MVTEEVPTLDFITELTSEGFSLDTASKIALFKGKVNKTLLVKAINGNVDVCLKSTNGLERGRKILQAAKNSFGSEFLKIAPGLTGLFQSMKKLVMMTKLTSLMKWYNSFQVSSVKMLMQLRRQKASVVVTRKKP